MNKGYGVVVSNVEMSKRSNGLVIVGQMVVRGFPTKLGPMSHYWPFQNNNKGPKSPKKKKKNPINSIGKNRGWQSFSHYKF